MERRHAFVPGNVVVSLRQFREFLLSSSATTTWHLLEQANARAWIKVHRADLERPA